MDEMDDEYCIMHDSARLYRMRHPMMLQLDHCQHGACKPAGLFNFNTIPLKAISHETDYNDHQIAQSTEYRFYT